MTKLDEAIAKGHNRYFKNSYWKNLYEDAPDDAKKYFDLIFSQLDGGNDPENDGEFRDRMAAAYRGLSDYGWEYLIHNTTNQAEKHHLQEKRRAFHRDAK